MYKKKRIWILGVLICIAIFSYAKGRAKPLIAPQGPTYEVSKNKTERDKFLKMIDYSLREYSAYGTSGIRTLFAMNDQQIEKMKMMGIPDPLLEAAEALGPRNHVLKYRNPRLLIKEKIYYRLEITIVPSSERIQFDIYVNNNRGFFTKIVKIENNIPQKRKES